MATVQQTLFFPLYSDDPSWLITAVEPFSFSFDPSPKVNFFYLALFFP